MWPYLIEDGRNIHFPNVMLYYFKKSKIATETQKEICAVYGEGVVTGWMYQKWFVKFHVGDFSLDHAPQSGRPLEVDNDQIEALIKKINITPGDSWHTQNIQISKVIGENVKCVFYFTEKSIQTFWPT